MIKFKVSKQAQKGVDKLIADFKEERGKMLGFTFDSILIKLIETKVVEKIMLK